MKVENTKSHIFLAFIFGCGLVIFSNLVLIFLPEFWRNLFVGKASISLVPSFQDFMWLILGIGIGEIIARVRDLKVVQTFDSNNYLPTNFEDLIDQSTLTNIIKSTKKDSNNKGALLPNLILQVSLQYRTNSSLSLTAEFFSKQVDLLLHEIELKYNNLKYIIWLIPSIGFMGTVYGIGLAVSKLGGSSIDNPNLLSEMAGDLGVAFNTTLLALLMSVILQFLSQYFESKEESTINYYAKYILDNLINKIVEKLV